MLQVEVIKKAYQQGETDFDDDEENAEEHAASPRNVGHNIYILAHQVNKHPNTNAHTQHYSCEYCLFTYCNY